MSGRASIFDALYAGNPDPWSVLTSPYERDKYAATLAALSRPTYAATLEIGCSIGVMTRALGGVSGRVVALDVSAVALAAATTRCAGLPVTFLQAEVPGGWPEGTFDLIVLSEVLYFLDPEEVAACAALTARTLAPDGEAVLVNWLGPTDTPLTGEAAAERFAAAASSDGLTATTVARAPFYRIDRLSRAPGSTGS